MHELERRRDVQERFRMSEQEIPSWHESLVETIDDPPSRFHIEVDQHIAAKDHIDLAHHERARAVHQVELPEMTYLLEFGRYLGSLAHICEVLGANFVLGSSKRRFAINAATRRCDRAATNVAADDLQVPIAEQAGLEEQN